MKDDDARLVALETENTAQRQRIAELEHQLHQLQQQLPPASCTSIEHQDEWLRLLESVVVHMNDAVLITEAQPLDEPGPRILFVNDAFEQMTGYTRSEVVGNTPRLLQGPDTCRDTLNQLRHDIENGQASHVELLNYRKNGTPFWVEMKISALLDTSGCCTYLVGIQRDITARKQAEDTLRTLQRAIEQSPSSVIITDPTGNIEYINPKFAQVTGYSTDEVLGQNPRMLKSGYLPPEAYNTLWQTITSGKEWHGEFHNRRKDGSLFWELASISPIFDDQGTITHFVAVKEDISERKQVEAALRDSEERYRVISELIFDYAYSFDVWPDNTTTCDWVTDAFRRITGYDLDELDPVNGWAKLIHPDDIPAASARIVHLLQNKADVSEFRIITKGGKVRWLRDYARPVWDEIQQRVVHIYGAAQDISERKQIEVSLQRHIRELEMLRITMNEISSDLNLDTLLRSILQRAVDLLEATDGELSLYDETTHHLLVLMCHNMGHDYSGTRLALNEGATGRVAATREPLIIDNYLTWEGKLPIYEVLGPKSVILVPLLAGEQLLGVIGIGHVHTDHERHFNDEDVRLLSLFAQQATVAIQNAHLFAEIQQLAMTDPLTGLYNRRHFFTLADDEFRHTHRYGSALSLIMLDVDYFKQVNDTYGHAVGDQVLQKVTERCKSTLRNRDLIGRYGGEEIVMLLPETDLEGARQVAERLHHILSATPIETSVGKIAITASMGVATYRKEYHASLEQLVDYADQGLYAAKQAGRNRVIVWDRALPND